MGIDRTVTGKISRCLDKEPLVAVSRCAQSRRGAQLLQHHSVPLCPEYEPHNQKLSKSTHKYSPNYRKWLYKKHLALKSNYFLSHRIHSQVDPLESKTCIYCSQRIYSLSLKNAGGGRLEEEKKKKTGTPFFKHVITCELVSAREIK